MRAPEEIAQRALSVLATSWYEARALMVFLPWEHVKPFQPAFMTEEQWLEENGPAQQPERHRLISMFLHSLKDAHESLVMEQDTMREYHAARYRAWLWLCHDEQMDKLAEENRDVRVLILTIRDRFYMEASMQGIEV